MALLFQDTFTEASNAELSTHTPDTGTSWSKVIGVVAGSSDTGSGSDLYIWGSGDALSGGIAGADSNDGAIYSADATYSSADYIVSVDVLVTDSDDDPSWLAVRIQDSNNLYALKFNSSVFTLYKKLSGTWSVIGADLGGSQIANGDSVALRVQGDTISTYANGLQKHNVTDSDISSAGKAGIGMGDVGAVAGEDVSLQRLDNFEVNTIELITEATSTGFGTSVTSMPVNLPDYIATGDLLLAFVEVRNSGTWTVPTDWVEFDAQLGGADVGELTAFYKIADGTEGATATWTAGTGTTAIWHVRKITDWHGTTPPESATSSGDAVNPDPPNLEPSWGSDDTLWLAIAGHTAAGTTTFASAAPTGYSDFLCNGASSGGAAVSLASAYKEATASSEDPGTFSTDGGSNRWWAAFTVGIRPAAAGGGASVTPSTATLTTTTFAPTVTASDNKSVTPSTASLTTTTFAPSVTASDHQSVTPTTASLTTSTFAPTISVSDIQSVTPDTATLSLTTFAPAVTATANVAVVPTTTELTITTFAPSVSTSNQVEVTPSTATLSLTTFAPTVSVSDNQSATPGTASLSLTTFAPEVQTPVTVTPSTAELNISLFAPTVSTGNNISVEPSTASLSLTLYAPTVSVTGHITVTPITGELILLTYAPTITASSIERVPLSIEGSKPASISLSGSKGAQELSGSRADVALSGSKAGADIEGLKRSDLDL